MNFWDYYQELSHKDVTVKILQDVIFVLISNTTFICAEQNMQKIEKFCFVQVWHKPEDGVETLKGLDKSSNVLKNHEDTQHRRFHRLTDSAFAQVEQ